MKTNSKSRKIIEEKEKISKDVSQSPKQDVADKIDLLKTQVTKLDQADDFLSKIDLKKDNISRLFAYLLKLSIIKDGKKTIGEQIVQLNEDYLESAKKLLENNFDSPLSKVQKSSANTITADIKRSLFWFEDACKIFGVEKSLTKGADEIAKRILCMIELTDEKLKYTQGFDRYVFLMYALSLYFVMKADIDKKYAETLSFHLAISLIKLSDPNQILDDPIGYDGFEKIDGLMEKHCPKTFAILNEAGQSAFHFALRWRLILFCDEHEANATLLIWDALLVHMKKLDEFFTYLACAHAAQVPIKDSFSIVEDIQRYRKWNNTKIIEDARIYSGDQTMISLVRKRKIKNISLSFLLFAFVFIAILSVFYYIQNTK